jgi:hypothetical protein
MHSTEEAIVRALCLAAVVTRANAEYLIGSGEPAPVFVELVGAEPKEAPSALNRWIAREGLTAGLSPKERLLMNVAAGGWSKRDALDASWRREALMVLLWGLRIVELMPAPDAQIDIIDLLQSAWLLRETDKLRTDARIRPTQDITKARNIAEFWLWRVRTTKLQHTPDSLTDPRTTKEKLDAIVAHAAQTGERDGLFTSIGGDFPAFGKAFRELNQSEWSLIHSICTERSYGLNWLCDVDGVEWDDVETST